MTKNDLTEKMAASCSQPEDKLHGSRNDEEKVMTFTGTTVSGRVNSQLINTLHTSEIHLFLFLKMLKKHKMCFFNVFLLSVTEQPLTCWVIC